MYEVTLILKMYIVRKFWIRNLCIKLIRVNEIFYFISAYDEDVMYFY